MTRLTTKMIFMILTLIYTCGTQLLAASITIKRLIFASKKENTFIIKHSLVMHDPFAAHKIPISNDVACTACQSQSVRSINIYIDWRKTF